MEKVTDISNFYTTRSNTSKKKDSKYLWLMNLRPTVHKSQIFSIIWKSSQYLWLMNWLTVLAVAKITQKRQKTPLWRWVEEFFLLVLGFGDPTKGMTRIRGHFVILVGCERVILRPQIMLMSFFSSNRIAQNIIANWTFFVKLHK